MEYAEGLMMNERSYEEPLSGWDGAEREEYYAAAATMACPAGVGDWVISIEDEREEERPTDGGVGQSGSAPEMTLVQPENAVSETSQTLNGPERATADEVEASGHEVEEQAAVVAEEVVAVAALEEVAVATNEDVAEATVVDSIRTSRAEECEDGAGEKPVLSKETVHEGPGAIDYRDERCASARSTIIRGTWIGPPVEGGLVMETFGLKASSLVELDRVSVDGASSKEESSTKDASVPEGATVDRAKSECDGTGREQFESGLQGSVEPLKSERLAKETPAGVLGTLGEGVMMTGTAPVASVAAEEAEIPKKEERLDEKGLGGPELEGEVDEPNAASLKRLFTPEELDKLEEGLTIGSSDTEDEYDKELEERLYPLDEVELQRRMKKNAELQKKLSLKEISTLLNIPLETLQRTQSASPGELSSPEYWLLWYRRTLAASEEARRANRDFKEMKSTVKRDGRAESIAPAPSDGRDVGGGTVDLGDEIRQSVREDERAEAVEVDEVVVYDNIGINIGRLDEAQPDVPEGEGEGRQHLSDLPLRDRSLTRLVAYLLLGDELRRGSAACPSCASECESPCLSEDCLEARAATKVRLLEPEIVADRLVSVARVTRVYYMENADTIRTKLTIRGLPEGRAPRASPVRPFQKRVSFKCSSLFEQDPMTFSDRPLTQAEVDDLRQDAYVVDKGDPVKQRPKPGLREVPEMSGGSYGVENLIEKGKRVIGTVSGVEALSTGYLDCTPAEMLIDSGAVASLVHARVLKRIGRANEPLRPYLRSLNGVTGHKVGIKGIIDLPLRLGSMEITRPFVVVTQLHVDAILGTDTLKAYRAVIDLDDSTLTLKDTGEVFPLGSPRVEETHESRMSATVRLQPGGQAIVVTEVLGEVAEGATLLVEGLPGLDDTVKVARSLCTAQEGKLLVEVCNASTEDVVLRRGTLVAAATIVPETAFQCGTTGPTHPTGTQSSGPTWTDAVIGMAARSNPSYNVPMPELEKVLKEELSVDFEGSKLSDEQQQLMKELLGEFKDMFVETSMTPGRTDLQNSRLIRDRTLPSSRGLTGYLKPKVT